MKNIQAAGTDFLSSASFKYGGNEFNNKMKKTVNNLCEREERPSRWKKGIICTLCGKGEKMNCTNFVGVTLYIVAY